MAPFQEFPIHVRLAESEVRIEALESELLVLKSNLSRMLDHAKGPVRCSNEGDLKKLEYRVDDLERDGRSLEASVDYIECHLVL